MRILDCLNLCCSWHQLLRDAGARPVLQAFGAGRRVPPRMKVAAGLHGGRVQTREEEKREEKNSDKIYDQRFQGTRYTVQLDGFRLVKVAKHDLGAGHRTHAASQRPDDA
eukprot:4300931-Prymnesium_polylepis.1